uniref:Lipoprotein n=1 Tax=Myxococcus fulvus TaxID=33 RepID=A0A3Q8I2X2_MYXFU|nr:hypothetical protein [Myxococcus fulvus]
MQIQSDVLWRRGVLLAVVMLAACNAGELDSEELSLESSEADLSCEVTQQCANGTTRSCSSASGICTSGADNGGWVECDGSRTTCPVACTCESARFTQQGFGMSFSCPAAWSFARNQAADLAFARCPKGLCNMEVVEDNCFRTHPPNNPWAAYVTMTYSCMGPANCQ